MSHCSSATIAMDPGGRIGPPGPRELVGSISNSLFTLFRTLTSTNSDITMYLVHHAVKDINENRHVWTKLDESYAVYEEQANHCRRLWMKLRASAEEISSTKATGSSSFAPEPRLRGRSPSPLEYQSEHGEDGPAKAIAPMDIDPVGAEGDDHRPPTLQAVDPPPQKQKPKKSEASTSKRVIMTPSGPTACRLAPIPKGVKLSVETNWNPAPKNPFSFKIPQTLDIDERKPLNRTKRNQPDTPSSQNSFSSLQFSSLQMGPSTAQTSVPGSPTMDYIYLSSREYWKPRRPFRSSDFKMDESRLFGSLDCLGSPFPVKMEKVTHNTVPALLPDLSAIYGGRQGITPKISSDKLKTHGFNHWMTPSVEIYPSVPAQPGWPGLMLRLDDGLEEWRPEEGTEFRVVVRKEPRFIEYIGQYEMIRLSDITGDEWKSQSAKVRKRWAHLFGGGTSWHWHNAVARVALRKDLGRPPTDQELKKYTETLRPEMYLALAKGLEKDIDRVYGSGEELITVWGMKCVGYDYEFEKHIARSLKGIRPSSSSSGTSKKCKAVANDDGPTIEDEDKKKADVVELHDPPPSKRQRLAKGKAKCIKYDWSGAQYDDDSRDEDYKPI